MKKYLGFVLPCLFAFSVYAQPLLVEENESTENEKSVSSEQAELKEETSAENNETTENSVTEDLSEANKDAVPDAKQGENTIPDENQDESMNQEIQPKPVEYLPNPSNFSADFMASLYQCQPNREQQNLSGYEEISIVGKVDNRCRLLYDDFVLSVPSELLPNIHSMDDIRQLLQNKDIARYQPKYEYSGLLQELNICGKSQNGHSAYLHRQTKNDVTITKGLTSKVENGGCSVRLLNQLNIGDIFSDYSVVCKIPANDMLLILDAYNDLLAQDNPATEELQKADAEIMYRLQQVGYCQKPKNN